MATESERKQILARIIDRLSLAYTNKEFSQEQIREWFQHMAQLDMPTAMKTCDEAIASYKWCPSISEFLEVSRSVRRHLQDATRAPDMPLSAHVLELQRKGLAVQRALATGRAERGLKHLHQDGWQACPICSGAHAEQDADACGTCYLLDSNGVPSTHVCQ